MVEQLICNQQVVGSSPSAGSPFIASLRALGGAFPRLARYTFYGVWKSSRVFPNAPLAFRDLGCYNRRMSFRRVSLILFVCLLSTGQRALLAQNNAVIDQARLFRDSNTQATLRDDATDIALSMDDAESDDDSMGVQQILKEHDKRPTLTISAGVSEVFTSNAALTRTRPRHDVFGVADVGVAWTPRLSPSVEVNAGAHASIFRYARTPELDFENFGAGLGLTWAPPSLPGFSVFVRYDLTQLLDSSGNHILTDNVFTGGAQKVFVFGSAHALTIGATGSLDFSNPQSAQRHQLSGFTNYHAQIARDLGLDLLWRPAAHFYEQLHRTDFNNIVSLTLRYRLTKYADVSAFASYGFNRSETPAFDYDVLTSGVGVVFSLRF